MADSKDDRRSPVHPLPQNRRRDQDQAPARWHEDADDASPDALYDALHRLAEDILDEPVPDRLLDILRKKQPKKD
ncbi:MAG: hypothetical protein R3F54_16640 [Alphaproteobacteria bacterium]